MEKQLLTNIEIYIENGSKLFSQSLNSSIPAYQFHKASILAYEIHFLILIHVLFRCYTAQLSYMGCPLVG